MMTLLAYRTISFRLCSKMRRNANTLSQRLGAIRYIWNHFLATNREVMKTLQLDQSFPRPNASFFSLAKEFSQLRKQLRWLAKLPAKPIKYSLKYYAKDWHWYFKSDKGFLKLKAKHHNNSFTVPDGALRLSGQLLRLRKIGQVCLSGNSPYAHYEAKTAVIREWQNKFYAVGEAETDRDHEAIGADMNKAQDATSGGEIRRFPGLKNLKLKRMTSSAKGWTDSPGESIEGKPGLNREILKTALQRVSAETSVQCSGSDRGCSENDQVDVSSIWAHRQGQTRDAGEV